MATEERVNNTRYIELTGKEAADLIGLLAAQLADEPLIGNQGGACPDVKITEMGQIKVWLSFIVDSKARYNAGEILQGDQTIIVLSKRDASDMIGLLSAQLAGWIGFGGYFQAGACPSVSVQDQGRILYVLSFSVKDI